MFVLGLSVLVLSMNVRVRVRVGGWGARSGFKGSTPTTALIKTAINKTLPAGVAAGERPLRFCLLRPAEVEVVGRG